MILDDNVKKVFERDLELVRDKISLKEDNRHGSLYAFGVGFAGMTYGLFYGVHESFIAGMIVSAGSLLYRCINNDKLCELKDDEASIEDVLGDPSEFLKAMEKTKK